MCSYCGYCPKKYEPITKHRCISIWDIFTGNKSDGEKQEDESKRYRRN